MLNYKIALPILIAVVLSSPLVGADHGSRYEELLDITYARTLAETSFGAEHYADVYIGNDEATCHVALANGAGGFFIAPEGTVRGEIDGEEFAGAGTCQLVEATTPHVQVAVIGSFIFSDGVVLIGNPDWLTQ